MALCAACKGRVEEGAVRCVNCDADLSQPGAFVQTIGWVVGALSTIPFAISFVTTKEENYIPLAAGIAILLFGIILVLLGKAKSRGAPPRVIADDRLSPGAFSAP